MRAFLAILVLFIAGLFAWLLWDSPGSSPALVQSELTQLRTEQETAAPLVQPQGVSKPPVQSNGSASQRSLATLAAAWRLRFVHAEDQSPLHSLDVFVTGMDEAVRTDRDGWCPIPASAGILSLGLDIDGDEEADWVLKHEASEDGETVDVPGLVTLHILQSAQNADRYPAEWINTVKRTQTQVQVARVLRMERTEDVPPLLWKRFQTDDLSPLALWDVLVGSDSARARRPIHNVAGTQEVPVELGGTGSVQLLIDATDLITPDVRLYVGQGQPLDLRDVNRTWPRGEGPVWRNVRDGRYRITVDSLSHARWEADIVALSPMTTVNAVLMEGPRERLRGHIDLPPNYSWDADYSRKPYLRFDRNEDIREDYLLFLQDEEITLREGKPVLAFDIPNIRAENWTIQPLLPEQVGGAPDYRFEPPSIQWKPGSDPGLLRFRLVPDLAEDR